MNSADAIREKRERLHMTQKELADAVGLGKFGDRTIRRWEKGESDPKPLEVKAILNFPETAPFKNPEHAKYDRPFCRYRWYQIRILSNK